MGVVAPGEKKESTTYFEFISIINPLHVSSRLTAQHQEVLLQHQHDKNQLHYDPANSQ